jgi:hypothetical protein
MYIYTYIYIHIYIYIYEGREKEKERERESETKSEHRVLDGVGGIGRKALTIVSEGGMGSLVHFVLY